jgi:predicted helicase
MSPSPEIRISNDEAIHYIYAVLHSPNYRANYLESLRLDFPKIPVARDPRLLSELGALGSKLIALHLLELPKVNDFITTYIGPRSPEVKRIDWSNDTVWLDAPSRRKDHPTAPGTIGFRGVPEAVWNFHVGGYQVCEKWLKDREGRTLSKDDIAHYQRIVVALAETVRLMKEIDDVIEVHGGWPGAFDGKVNLSNHKESELPAVRDLSTDAGRL